MRINLISFCIAFSLLFGYCIGDDFYSSMSDLREIQQKLSDVISKTKSLNNLTEISEREDVIKEKHGAFEDGSTTETDENTAGQIQKYKATIKKLRKRCDNYAKLVSELINTCKNLQEKVSKYQKKYEKYKNRNDKKKNENIKLKQLLKSEQDEKAQKISQMWFDTAKSGNYEEMKELVEQISDVNYQDEEGNTALILAAEKGHEDIVKLLLQQSFIAVNVANKNGRTPLSAAINSGNKNIVEMLVEEKAIITAESLSIAVELENKGIVEILLKHYNRPDRKQVIKKILKDAIEEGNNEMVSLLTEKDAYVNKANKDGMTPLMIAADSGEITIVQQLISTKAEINKQDVKGRTPLMYAVNSNKSSAAIVELLARKADLNVQDQKGWTALMHAANNPDGLKKMKVLLKYGADLSLKNKKGQTALDIAKENLEKALKTKSLQIKEFEDIVNELEGIHINISSD